jgi:hypothetical protein
MKEKTHCLKTQPEFFEAVCNGSKRFEIRMNDRGFLVNDRVILVEHVCGNYTGRVCPNDGVTFRISYVTSFEQKPGYCVFGIV